MTACDIVQRVVNCFRSRKTTTQRPAYPLVKRGQLIHFKCTFDGKVRCSWKAIFHHGNTVHTVGMRRKGGTHQIGNAIPQDKITKIKRGILVERLLTDNDLNHSIQP